MLLCLIDLLDLNHVVINKNTKIFKHGYQIAHQNQGRRQLAVQSQEILIIDHQVQTIHPVNWASIIKGFSIQVNIS